MEFIFAMKISSTPSGAVVVSFARNDKGFDRSRSGIAMAVVLNAMGASESRLAK